MSDIDSGPRGVPFWSRQVEGRTGDTGSTAPEGGGTQQSSIHHPVSMPNHRAAILVYQRTVWDALGLRYGLRKLLFLPVQCMIPELQYMQQIVHDFWPSYINRSIN